jgi:two-component sensor histidine kinase
MIAKRKGHQDYDVQSKTTLGKSKAKSDQVKMALSETRAQVQTMQEIHKNLLGLISQFKGR